jgi:hypothetical protein
MKTMVIRAVRMTFMAFLLFLGIKRKKPRPKAHMALDPGFQSLKRDQAAKYPENNCEIYDCISNKLLSWNLR